MKSLIEHFAENSKAKVFILEILDNPYFKLLLDAISEQNNPALQISSPDNCDPITAIALDAAKRAGVQECIRMIKQAPYLEVKRRAEIQPQPRPWSYLSRDQVQVSQSTESQKIEKRPAKRKL